MIYRVYNRKIESENFCFPVGMPYFIYGSGKKRANFLEKMFFNPDVKIAVIYE